MHLPEGLTVATNDTRFFFKRDHKEILMASLFKFTHHTVTHHTVLHNTGTLYTTAVLITENFNIKIKK